MSLLSCAAERAHDSSGISAHCPVLLTENRCWRGQSFLYLRICRVETTAGNTGNSPRTGDILIGGQVWFLKMRILLP